MTNRFKAAIVCLGLAVLFFQSTVLAAEKPKQTPPAPIPAQILAAKKVFVANAGEEQPYYEDPLFSGGPDRAYNQFYAAIKTSGRLELVDTPSDADVLLEIQFSVPRIDQKVVRGEAVLIPIDYDPQFHLVIRDPKTNAVLWVFTEHAEWAIRQTNRDKNFDQALAKLVGDVQGLSTQSAAQAGDANKP